MKKGKSNVDLADKVLFFLFSFFFFFRFLILFFIYLKCGATPLYIAAQKGHEQIVQILLKKGKPNVDLADVVFLFLFFFFFFFFFSFFFFFLNLEDGATPLFIAAQNGHEQIVQLLLKKGKANIDLLDKVLLFIFIFILFLFHFFFIYFLLNLKDRTTPLYIAAQNGHEQIVQILLEKGKSHIDLATEVLLFILLLILLSWFLIFFSFFHFLNFYFIFLFIFLI